MDEAWLASLRVADLKAKLANYDLPGTGKKAELQERLRAHLESLEARGEVLPPPTPPVAVSPRAWGRA